MANVLTDLAADIYKAADTVGRELVGFIPAATINADSSERVAKNGVIRAAYTRSATAGDITESMTIPEGTDQTVDNKTMTISKARSVQIPWTGEDMIHVNNGAGFETVYGDQLAQAMRTLSNEVESDLSSAAYTAASRAIGTAGTTPFASNFNLVAEARQIIVDNGGVANDGRLALVMNSSAGAKMRNLASLNQVNTSGTEALLRQGVLLDLQGVSMRESAQVKAHTKGTGTSYVVNNAATEIVGQTVITLDGGSGTVIAGDCVTFAGDANIYVVQTALAGGDLVLNATGLIEAAANDAAMTVGNDFAANVMFHQSALEVAMRAPAVAGGDDAAIDAMMVQDPHSGLVFEIRVYKGYRKQMIEVAATWGVKAWKSENIALVLG
jgi:hypothetical protein|tara:strand:- start:1878 stop:3026 length:1149 start_codon:yes stop_codon:yes gene_type:complete